MTGSPADILLPAAVRARTGDHYNRHGKDLTHFRRAVHEQFVAEVERMCQSFVQSPLDGQAGPILSALSDYTAWLGWCAWCSSHLAPPLKLIRQLDAKRMAAALIVYCGPRLIDDAIDDHRSYKDKHETALQKLISAFPALPDATVRCHVALLGSWMIFYGLRRLRRHGDDDAAQQTHSLCEQIAPGAMLENLHAKPLSWEEYGQVVWLKAVCYDQILYRNLLHPVDEPLKSDILPITERISRLAQYLNDLRDVDEDLPSGRRNLLEWFPSREGFFNLCRTEVTEVVESIERLPTELADACFAALVETVDAAARLRKL